MTILFKIIFLIIIIIIFSFVSYKNIEKFTVEENKISTPYPYNTRINNRNVGIYPWQRTEINSSIPIDIKLENENSYYYEYSNEEYEDKLKKTFKNDCKKLIIATEGANWSEWKTPDESILNYYNKIYDYINDALNKSEWLKLKESKKIQIVHDILKRYRYNKDDNSYLMFDIELLLYRENKLNGKHIKLYVVSNNININVILVKLIGVVSEDNIAMYPIIQTVEIEKENKNFSIFIPEKRFENKNILINKLISTYDSFYEVSEKITNSAIEEKIYQDLETIYDTQKEDLSNLKK